MTIRFTKSEASVIRILVEQVVELIAEVPPGGAEGALADIAPVPPNGSDGTSADRPPTVAGGRPTERIPDANELAAMVGIGEPAGLGEPEVPDDPVLARLLPDGYRDDPEAALEFRKFTESSLRSAKVQAAKTLLATLPPDGGRIKLSSTDAEAWLRSLNDVRLALGVRLGVTEELDGLGEDAVVEDPRFGYILFIYHWLAELQDSLVTALS